MINKTTSLTLYDCLLSKYFVKVSLRGCLKEIDKIARSFELSVIFLNGSVKIRDFEQYLVWYGLNSKFPAFLCLNF